MRCALVEFNHYHDEVLPTFVWLLNRLDITPDVYMVERSARRRAFARSEGLRYRIRAVETMDRLGGLDWRRRRYDLAIVNSMEPPENLGRAAGLGVPVLGVVHNAHLLQDDAAYRAFFAARDHRPLVLGQHIAEQVGASAGAPWWISHVVFGAPPREARTPGGPTIFAVSGNVEFARRNYDSLLDAATTLAGEDAEFVVEDRRPVHVRGREGVPRGGRVAWPREPVRVLARARSPTRGSSGSSPTATSACR